MVAEQGSRKHPAPLFPYTSEVYFYCQVTFNEIWYTYLYDPDNGSLSEDTRAKVVRANLPLYAARINERLKTESMEVIQPCYEKEVRDLYDTAMATLHSEYVISHDDISVVRPLLKLSTKNVREIPGHPHKYRARDRQIALNTMEEIAHSLGLSLYSVSTGDRENKRGWAGSREHFFPIDIKQPRRVDEVTSDQLICFVDVDYYVERSTFERYSGLKMALFTVEVDGVGGGDGESMWHVDGLTFHERIAGGATWKHHVWDFSGALCTIRDGRAAFTLRDKIEYERWTGSRRRAGLKEVERLYRECGHVVYHVERIRFPGTNKMIVFLNPSFRVTMPWDFTCLRFGVDVMEHDLLFRMPTVTVHNTSRGSFRVGIFGGSHPYVSISYKEATRHVVKIPLNLWHSLILRSKGVRAWGAEIVDSHMKSVGHTLPPESVMLLAAALIDIPENIHFVGYSADTADLHDNTRDVAKLVVPPVLPPAAASAQTTADMAKAIDTLVHNRNTVVPPADIRGFAKEFVRETALRTPWTTLGHDETLEVMLRSNPARKAEIEKFMDNPRNTEKSLLAMIKAECVAKAAAKGKNARLILPQSTYELYVATRFIKPWSEQAHKRGPTGCGDWFVCGSDPTEIADAVTLAVHTAELNGNILTATDFKKFDQSHSPFTRECFTETVATSCQNTCGDVEVRRVLRWELDKTIVPKVKNQRNHPALPKINTVKSGAMNLSGAADTTALNTFTNALLSYITMRRLGQTHLQAFDNIKPKYGDDGLEEHIECWLDTIKMCGFEGTIEPRLDNNKPIAFLSRIYVKPLETNTSICDPARALMKLPTSCSKRPVYLARRDKAFGYATVDGNTPLVGDYARAILRVYNTGPDGRVLGTPGDPVKDPTSDGPIRCNTSEGRELKRKIDRGCHPYCDDYDDVVMVTVAEQLSMSVEEVEQLSAAYNNAQTPEDMIKLESTDPSQIALGCRALPTGYQDQV